MTIIAISLVCVAAAYWLLSTKKKKPGSRVKLPSRIKRPVNLHNRYQAASINYGGCACSAVKAIGDKRFLAEQAPRMPLSECNAAKCDCKYVRHEDRRAKEDRRAIYCLQTDLYSVGGGAEQRAPGSCRRTTDAFTSAASDFDYKDVKWAS